ncbi:MAG: error-prone DNA polymerase [Acidobacteriota bacterium]
MFIELHARSAFSFLAGSSLPEDIVEACAELDIPALALLDRDNVSSAVRFHKAATGKGIKAHIGAEVTLDDGSALPLIAVTREGYRNLCRLISEIKLRAPKGEAAASSKDLAEYSKGLLCLTGDKEGPVAKALLSRGVDAASTRIDELRGIYGPSNVYIELQRHHDRLEEDRNQALISLAASLGLPLIASNGVSYARPDSRQLLDVLTCIKSKVKIHTAGRLLSRNAERFVKDARQMEALFGDLPAAIANTRELSSRIEYTMSDLGYQFPTSSVPPGETLDSYLRKLSVAGAIRRYGSYSGRQQKQIEHELGMIQRLGLAGYFLVVWELVEFCREMGFLVQGRGSAANSAVCYSLGITAVDPVKMELLFERFLSEERGEWPDIDLDLPSGDDRESVIQHVYEKYGRRGAAMTANIITYRSRMAIREVGKVLGFGEEKLDLLSKLVPHFEWNVAPEVLEPRIIEAGLSSKDKLTVKFLDLYRRIQDLPRHLGQHSGGMVICQGSLDALVPLEPATMPGRSIVQWDKEDIADMGIIKVDLLGLGMMAVLKETITLVREHYHEEVDLAHLPADDPKVYRALQQGDTVGWFQVESRAQMSCLPRTRPAHFYDLVVQVAIIRPGPIVGQMASPYIRRRQGKERPVPLHPSLEPVLERTLGVPLFQEQLMRMAMTVANFTAGEAEDLRRACGSKRSKVAMQRVEDNLRRGMTKNDICGEVQERIVKSITSFAMYGFPESHAASFALLAYASGFLKCYYLAAFTAAMLNNQPMGFYAPMTLVKDAQRHGLHFLPADIHLSKWVCTLEWNDEGELCVRLGFNYIRSFRQETADSLIAERDRRDFSSMHDLSTRVPQMNKKELRNLSAAGVLHRISSHRLTTRRDALWDAELVRRPVGPLLSQIEEIIKGSPLEQMTEMERVVTDLKLTGVSIGKHPIAFLRSRLDGRGVTPLIKLAGLHNNALVQIAGVVICRQRPGTAKGIVFLSLEDETGIANVIVMPDLFEKTRGAIVNFPALFIVGLLQNLESSISVKALKVVPLEMVKTSMRSHDFH